MSYIDRVLQPGEMVRFRTTLSWLTMVPAFCMLLVALTGAIAIWIVTGNAFGGAMAGVIFGLPAGYFLLREWLRMVTTEIVVTNMRIVFKRGFIRRRTIEMNMDKVESVDVDQSILGRLFNFGEVLVGGTGSGFEPLRMVDNPLALRNQITVSG